MLQGIIELRIISDMLCWNVPDRASLQHNWIEYILKSLFSLSVKILLSRS